MKFFDPQEKFDQWKNHTAFIEANNFAITYGNWFDEIKKLTQVLVRYPSSLKVIGTFGLTSRQTHTVFWACIATNRVLRPLNDQYPLSQVTQKLGALDEIDGLIIGSAFSDHDLIEKYEHIYFFNELMRTATASVKVPDSRLFGQLIPRQHCLQLQTSGSTGKKKIVILSVKNLILSASGSNLFYKLSIEHSWLQSLNIFHMGGFMIPLRAFMCGATVFEKSREESLELALKKYSPDVISLVPTQLSKLIQKKETLQPLQRCTAVLLGGDKCSPQIIEKALELRIPISLTYGASESTAQLTATIPGKLAYLGSSGTLLPFREMRINQGIIEIRGDTRFQGYLEKGEIKKPFDQDGWFRTSDYGKQGQDNDLFVLGRADDIIISGGNKISPWELESIMNQITLDETCHIVSGHDFHLGSIPLLAIWSTNRPDWIKFQKILGKKIPLRHMPREIHWLKLPENPQEKLTRKKASSMIIQGHSSKLWCHSEQLKHEARNENM